MKYNPHLNSTVYIDKNGNPELLYIQELSHLAYNHSGWALRRKHVTRKIMPVNTLNWYPTKEEALKAHEKFIAKKSKLL